MRAGPTLRIVLTFLFMLFGAVSGARADLITGVWDPLYGPPFGTLGWRGTAQFNVPGACLGQPDGVVFNTDPCSAGAMTVLNATVELYDTLNPLVTIDTLVFNPASMSVFSVDLLSNAVDGIDTGYSNFVASSFVFGPGAISFSLNFDLDGAKLIWGMAEDDPATNEGLGQVSGTKAAVTYTPEPASLALAAAALLAAGLATRRARS